MKWVQPRRLSGPPSLRWWLARSARRLVTCRRGSRFRQRPADRLQVQEACLHREEADLMTHRRTPALTSSLAAPFTEQLVPENNTNKFAEITPVC